ncbi:hypothetical protein ACFLYE_01035 [Chloroflexota bacterium]
MDVDSTQELDGGLTSSVTHHPADVQDYHQNLPYVDDYQPVSETKSRNTDMDAYSVEIGCDEAMI